MDGGGNSFRHSRGVSGGAHSDGNVNPGTLIEGDEDLFALALERTPAHIVVNADNLPLLVRAQFLNTGDELFDIENLTDRILVGEIVTNELFVDHSNPQALGIIVFGKGATFDEANTERFEVVGRYHAEAGGGALRGVSKVRLTGYGERHPETRSLKGHGGTEGGALDSGGGLDAANDLLIVCADLIGL